MKKSKSFYYTGILIFLLSMPASAIVANSTRSFDWSMLTLMGGATLGIWMACWSDYKPNTDYIIK